MKIKSFKVWLNIFLFFIFAVPGRAEEAFNYSALTLVDAVECASDTAHEFCEFPSGTSRVETILGASVRSLPNDAGETKYFAYRIGAGLGLEADKGYVLRVIYPEDQPRSMFIINRGCETARGFHTGRTTGDGLHVPYVDPNAESLELPLSGKMESWEMLFYLQERYPGMVQPRDSNVAREQTPEDGFLVFCLQLSPTNDPLSGGVAIERIELYEAPAIDEMAQPLAELPAGLPARHLFWREEMADGVIGSTALSERGYADDMTWYEGKFRLMRFLGMRTFAKDLLEFGANQGWDSTKFGGNSWVYQSKHSGRWSRIVRRCSELGFDLMPYYEYAGSKGSSGYGNERRAEPLYGRGSYTHISWSEVANADLTDPDTFEDFRKMLEITVADEQEYGHFAGVWMRTRVSDLPISFADATRARFEAETGLADISRERLNNEPALYNAYIDWWYGKRRDFLEQVRNYLRANVHSSMDLLYTADSSEPGKSLLSQHRANVIAEDPSVWLATSETVKTLADATEQNWELLSLTNNWGTWGYYEWHHSIPHPDPSRYKQTDGIYMTETVNRAYTLEPDVMEAFHVKDGLAAIRHYGLNEHATQVSSGEEVVGYFVADVDYAGPFVVLPEAMAFANGDPKYFGYLASNNFNRGNPYYVRRFNASFLALPALPSVKDARFCLSPDVVVRRIDTPANGTYLGAVHLGRKRADVTLSLPEPGILLDAVSGEAISTDGQELVLTMDPYELRSFRFFAASSNTPPEILIEDSMNLNWYHALTTHGSWLTVELNPTLTDHDAGDEVVSVEWSCIDGDSQQVRFDDPSSACTQVAFAAPGAYELNLRVSDGKDVRDQKVTVNIACGRSQIVLDPAMADYTGTDITDSGLFDQQLEVGDPPTGELGATPATHWGWKQPVDFIVDMGQCYQLTDIWLYDANNIGQFRIYGGSAEAGWTNLVDMTTDQYKSWRRYDVDVQTRYLKIEQVDGGAIVHELVLFGRGDGLDSTEKVPRRPLKPQLKCDPAAARVNYHFNANPFCVYQLDYSTDLTEWTPVQSWVEGEPFPDYSGAISTHGFFKLIESQE